MLALIPLQYRAVAIGMVAIALIASGAAGGWNANGWRLKSQLERQGREHSAAMAEISRVSAQQLLAQQNQRQQLEAKLASIDQQHYQELQNAQTITDSLTADLAAARQRMSVRTTRAACSGGVPGASGPARLDDGAERADIHPEDAAAIARITGDADRCAVKLGALQEWVRANSSPKPYRK